MKEILLKPVPNQSLSFNASGIFWRVDIKDIPDGVCASVWADGVKISGCARALEGQCLLPFGYMAQNGNLAIYTGGGAVDWKKFGDSQSLFFLTPEEL